MTKEIPAVNIHRFVGVPDMRKTIIALDKAVQEGSTIAQYLAFEFVTTENRAKIHSYRRSLVSEAHENDLRRRYRSTHFKGDNFGCA